MSCLISGFLVIGIFAGCAGNCAPRSVADLVKTENSSTVALVHTKIDPDDGSRSTGPFCTGVWVNKTMILTAHHCVVGIAGQLEKEGVVIEKLSDITIQYIVENEVVGIGRDPSAMHNAKIKGLDKENDLALLEAVNESSVPNHGIAELAESAPIVGERLSFIGHVKGFYWTYVEGPVAGYREDLDMMGQDRPGPFMQVSAPIYFGNSGGGAFDKDGKLVGIASFIYAGMPLCAFYEPLETIRSFLAGFKVVRLRIDETRAPSGL